MRVIKKNSLEQVRVEVGEYRGRPVCHARIYYQDDEGEWRPTTKGIALRPALWPEFVQGVQELDRYLHEEGLLEDTGCGEWTQKAGQVARADESVPCPG